MKSGKKNKRGKEIAIELQKTKGTQINFAHNASVASLGVQPYADFTISTAPGGLDRLIVNALKTLKPEQVSDMILQIDKGSFVYLIEKTVPELDINSPQVSSRMKILVSSTKRGTLRGILNEMFEQSFAANAEEE